MINVINMDQAIVLVEGLLAEPTPQLLVTILVIWSTVGLLKNFRRRRELNRWIERARKERAERQFLTLEKTIPADVVEKIDAYSSARALSKDIQKGRLGLLDTVVHFSLKCRTHGRNENRVNAITEELYDEAYAQAEGLLADNRARGSKTKNLFGLPISIKECYSVAGCLSTGGLACRLKSRREDDSLIVKLLKNAGAIPLCLGNTVQTMMLSESVNRIWGRSRNPWDLKRTPGGSSGGDAALVAMKCVPLALGGDVAGSVRIPACFCGIVGFKPTSNRLSLVNNMRPRKDDRMGTAVIIPATPGPLGRTVDDCVLFMQSVCVPELWESDVNVPPMPFQKELYENKGPMKVAYFETDKWFQPCATSTRALKETIQGLTEAGYTCVKMEEPPTDGWFNYSILLKVNTADGRLRSFIEGLEGEPLVAEFNTLKLVMNIPDILRWVICKLDSSRRGYLLSLARRSGLSVYEVWSVLADLLEMRKKWSAAFNELGIDAVIFPGMPIPAFPHGMSSKLTAPVSYMFIANLLLWPCGTVPVTTIKPEEENYNVDDIPPNQRDSIAKLVQQSMKGSSGLPMSVSVMCPAFRDETCLKVMKDIESFADFKAEPKAYCW